MPRMGIVVMLVRVQGTFHYRTKKTKPGIGRVSSSSWTASGGCALHWTATHLQSVTLLMKCS
jgi:hypothetical protein